MDRPIFGHYLNDIWQLVKIFKEADNKNDGSNHNFTINNVKFLTKIEKSMTF